MKKVILSVAAVFAFGFANAQETVSEGFTKGDVFISGAVGFGSTKTGDFKTSDFVVAPKVGYFVTDNIAVGVAVGYESSKIEVVDDLTNNTFSVGAFGRYYFTPASKFSIFGELGLNYNNYDNEFGVDNDGLLVPVDGKGDGFGVSVAPGVSYFIAKNFALEASFGILGYNSTKPDFEGAEKTNSFEFGLDTRDIRLGLVYKF